VYCHEIRDSRFEIVTRFRVYCHEIVFECTGPLSTTATRWSDGYG
jgi:hypothetical protein